MTATNNIDDHIIEVRNVSKTYYHNPVLKNVSFSISRGKFYALLGENGAGKSTLLKILVGMERFERGEGHILGASLGQDLEQVRAQTGYVSESIDYDVPLKMREFVQVYQQFYPQWDQAFFDILIKDRKIDLNKYFKDYSRGQKMQFSLILALAARPQIILIDEITSVLDVYARKYFMSHLHNMTRAGGTVIMTTNIISEVQNFATHLLLLNKGEIQLNSPIDELPGNFIKLRRAAAPTITDQAGPNPSPNGPNQQDSWSHPVFNDPSCYWAGTNSDLSTSYIVPKELLERYQVPESLIDKRRVQLDDIFIYYYNCKIESEHEAAA